MLQILTENVSRGSVVYEKGHILVLAWANTQRDREVIWKILSQVGQLKQMCFCTLTPVGGLDVLILDMCSCVWHTGQMAGGSSWF